MFRRTRSVGGSPRGPTRPRNVRATPRCAVAMPLLSYPSHQIERYVFAAICCIAWCRRRAAPGGETRWALRHAHDLVLAAAGRARHDREGAPRAAMRFPATADEWTRRSGPASTGGRRGRRARRPCRWRSGPWSTGRLTTASPYILAPSCRCRRTRRVGKGFNLISCC